MAAKKKEYKVELFPLLRNIATKNSAYFDSLTEDQRKEISPYLIMRWLTGCNDGSINSAKQIYFINAVVNPLVFPLGKHKKLLYDLMSASCTGKDCRWNFNKSNQKKGAGFTKTTAVIKTVFGYSTKEAVESLPLLTNATIVEMAEDLGYQKDELAALKRELKKRA